MKNYVQPGRAISLPAPYDVKAGDGLKVGSIFGVAAGDAASGADVEAALTGVYDLKKAASQAWTIGVRVYWDDTAKSVTTASASNTLIGVALEAVGAGAGETLGRVRLNGAF